MKFGHSLKLALSLTFAFLICTQTNADQVLSVLGDVVLVRANEQYRIQNRSELRDGDMLISYPNGAVSFAMGNGAFIYTAANTKIRLQNGTLNVLQGQVRVITRNQEPLAVSTRDGKVFLNGGAHLIGVSQRGSRFASQSGSAEVQWNSRQNANVGRNNIQQVAYQPVSQSATINQSGEINLANGQAYAVDPQAGSWNIQVAMLQQQGINNAVNSQLNQVPLPPGQGQAPGAGTPGSVAQGTSPGQVNQQQQQDDLAANQRGGQQEDQSNRRPPDVSATQFGSGGLSSIFSGFGSSAGLSASGGANSDANQGTNQGQTLPNPPGTPFPGNIHLITADQPYQLDGMKGIKLTSDQLTSIVAKKQQRYFSVTEGMPTGQVSTDFSTATNVGTKPINIPGTNNYVIQFEQYNIPDPATNPASNPVGITGLLGATPAGPSITNATVADDTRAQFNKKATFALGEFRLGRKGDNLEFGVRRSDQDRTIVKDGGGDDSQDIVTPNSHVLFDDAVDPRFFPAAPLVKVPVAGSFDTTGTRFSQLNDLRRGAATVILADQLHDISKATGQTRFAIDGKIIDISGYRKP